MKTKTASVCVSACWLCFAAPVLAQSYPSKPVTILVPTSPGTTHDVISRLLAPMLAQKLGQPFIVENRPGASGNIGTAAVAKASPDGHTLLVTGSTLTMTPYFYKDLPYNPVADLAPVGTLYKVTMTLAVHPSVPATSVSEFIAHVRSRPGQLNYGSPGNGTPHHLMMELLKQQVQLFIVHIPYKGTADAVTGMLSGSVEAGFMNLLPALPLAKAHKIRILSISGSKRSMLAPEVPTFHEAKIEELDTDPWIALFAPGRTPAHIIVRLNREVMPLMDHPNVKEVLRNQGLDAFTGTPEQLGELVRTELARWQRVVTQAGIKPD